MSRIRIRNFKHLKLHQKKSFRIHNTGFCQIFLKMEQVIYSYSFFLKHDPDELMRMIQNIQIQKIDLDLNTALYSK